MVDADVGLDAGVSPGAGTSTETDAAGALGDTGLPVATVELTVTGTLADTGGAGAGLGAGVLAAGRGALVGAGTLGDGSGAVMTITGMPGRRSSSSLPLLSVSPVPCATGETARTGLAPAVSFSTGAFSSGK